MTADEFVAALAMAAGMDVSKRTTTRAWSKIRKRKRPAFDHPPDPVLDLLAWYNLSKLEFWQLKFLAVQAPDFECLWHVATKATDDFYIEDGRLLKMYYKECFPGDTGLTSGQFLELVAIYAQMIALLIKNSSGPFDPLFVEYGERAAKISPNIKSFNWFWEYGRRKKVQHG